ncbi:DUF3800 domain-containing protein [Actinosynnema sp. NPDC050436]|uniref:DUF3800 domain-containing protein n=1 Tax=Actinosynnema sp. NPDC050436 TaxID=3155659 RepID=UPI0033E2A933
MHAFVDESRRNDTYLLAMAIVQPKDLSRLRKHLRGLLFPGQRELHFKLEKPARRRFLLAKVVEFGIRVDVYRADCRRGEEAARQQCLVSLADDLLDNQVRRVVFDSRPGRDKLDEITIRGVLGKQAREERVVYEHLDSTSEPLVWLADIVAWCYGAGGDWARRAAPVLGNVIRLDRP